MSDRKARPFAPVVDVEVINAGLCVIRFRYDTDADRRGPSTGAARIPRCSWARGYWPPTKGDVIRIVEAPTITLEARPR